MSFAVAGILTWFFFGRGAPEAVMLSVHRQTGQVRWEVELPIPRVAGIGEQNGLLVIYAGCREDQVLRVSPGSGALVSLSEAPVDLGKGPRTGSFGGQIGRAGLQELSMDSDGERVVSDRGWSLPVEREPVTTYVHGDVVYLAVAGGGCRYMQD